MALIRAGQEIGLSLSELSDALATLPHEKTPTKSDWTKLSRSWRKRLDDQIQEMMALRDELSDCIGCGCLSLKSCAIFNPGDAASDLGTGPRYLLGDSSEDLVKR